MCCASCQKQEKADAVESVAVMTQPQPKGEAATAGTRAVTIAATSAWNATTSDGWLTVSPSHGEKGIQEVIISFSENTTGEVRSGKVVFTSGSYSESFTLTQNK